MFVMIFGGAVITILAYVRQAGHEFTAGCREVLVGLRWVWAMARRFLSLLWGLWALIIIIFGTEPPTDIELEELARGTG